MKESKIIGVKTICNLLSIGITSLEDERVTYKWLNGSNREKEHKATLYYNNVGNVYFKDNNGHRQYLNDFIRTDI